MRRVASLGMYRFAVAPRTKYRAVILAWCSVDTTSRKRESHSSFFVLFFFFDDVAPAQTL
jgi:hypothetical protein